MKILDLKQGSQEWLSWRRTVITATDCPAILGSSPWETNRQCWERKLGLVPEKLRTKAMERGIRLEPEARTQFIERYGINMAPAVVESTEIEFLGASLDGLSDCKRYILEVKCGGAKLQTMAAQGIVPEYYLDQIYHQLYVTGAEKCYYYCYDGKNGICIEVYLPSDFIAKYLPMVRTFWKCVALNEPPATKVSGYNTMNDDEWTKDTNEYQKLDQFIKSLEEKKETVRQRLISRCGDYNCMGNGVKVIKTILPGRIAYNEIPEIKEVDLEKYRKDSTISWRILTG